MKWLCGNSKPIASTNHNYYYRNWNVSRWMHCLVLIAHTFYVIIVHLIPHHAHLSLITINATMIFMKVIQMKFNSSSFINSRSQVSQRKKNKEKTLKSIIKRLSRCFMSLWLIKFTWQTVAKKCMLI